MIPFLVIIGILGILNISDRLSRFLLSHSPASLFVKYFKVLGAALLAVLLFPMVSGVWSYNRSIALPDTRTAAAQWINQNARKGSAIATGPFGVELSDSIYISLPIQFSAVASERMAPFYDTRWYEDVDLLIASDFDLGRYRLDPIRYHEMLGFYDSLRSSWELVKEITPNENLTGPSIWMFRSKGSDNIGIFPHELTERLRLAELESTRKVDFLGKLGLILLLKGKLYKSEQVFSELLKIDPQNPEAKRAISQVRIQLAQANSGGSNVSSVATHKEVVDSLVLRAENLLQQNRFGEAETLYLQVLNLDRTVDAAYESLMVIYAAQNEKGRVIQILRKYIAVLPPGGERYRLVEEQLKQLERSDE